MIYGYIAPDGGYAISNVDGFQPELYAGDSITFAIQIQNAPFRESDFTITCSTGGNSENSNSAPVADDLTVMLEQDTAASFQLTANDTDQDTLTYSVIAEPSNGVLTGVPPLLSYTPSASFLGNDSLSFQVSDGTNTSNIATVAFEVSSRPNQAPIADAGEDVQSDLRDVITLFGQGTDPEGDTLTFNWSLVSKPSNSKLTNPPTGLSTFDVVPDVVGDYVFELIVNDGTVNSEPDSKTVSVSLLNTAPTADAGENLAVNVDSTIELSGSGTDEEGDPLVYEWSIVETPPGAQPALSNSTEPTALFSASTPGTYKIHLVVSDPYASSDPDSIDITVNPIVSNSAPTADAGEDINLTVGQSADLIGVGFDSDGDELTYQWEVISKPTNSLTDLDGNARIVEFHPDRVGIYRVRLIVNDGIEDSIPDVAEISVGRLNSPPVVNVSYAFQINGFEMSEILIDASATTDLDEGENAAQRLVFNWEILEPGLSLPFSFQVQRDVNGAETGPTATIQSRRFNSFPELTRIRITASDGIVESDPYLLEISSGGSLSPQGTSFSAPILNSIPPIEASVSEVVNLSTTLSGLAGDPFGIGVLSLAREHSVNWTVISAPVSSVATLSKSSENLLSSSNSVQATNSFTPDVAGEYLIEVTADNLSPGGSSTDVIVVRVENPGNIVPQAVVSGGGEQVVRLNDSPAVFALDGTPSIDADGDPLGFQWSIVSEPIGSFAGLGDSTEDVARLTMDVRGEYVISLVVNDGQRSSQETLVVITAVGDTPNQLPVSVPGTYAAVPVDASFQLDGYQSYDPDGDPVSYRWALRSQTDSEGVSLDPFLPSANGNDEPNFLAPASLSSSLNYRPVEIGLHEFELTVTDSQGASSTESVVVNVVAANRAPQASTGFRLREQLVRANGTSTLLRGSDSSDPDGDPLTYKWEVSTRPESSQYSLDDPSAADFTFTPDVNGRYRFLLTVSDGEDESVSHLSFFIISVPNNPPVTIAPERVYAPVDQTVTIDLSDSYDPDGDDVILIAPLIIASPEETSFIYFSASRIDRVNIGARTEGVYDVIIRTYDRSLISAPTVTKLIVGDPKPEAIISGNDVASVGESTSLFGSSSISGNGFREFHVGTELRYQWQIVSAPPQSNVSLESNESSVTRFIPDVVGEYEVGLVVTDENNLVSDSTIYSINVEQPNRMPIADAGFDLSGNTNTDIALSASGSSDEDNDILTYHWTIESSPDGSTPTINDETLVNPTFNADTPGEYVFALQVSDGELESIIDRLRINLTAVTINMPPKAVISETFSFGYYVRVNGLASSDPEGEALSYIWQLVSKPEGSHVEITNFDSGNITVSADITGIYTVQLIVNDGFQNSIPVNVSFELEGGENAAPVAFVGVNERSVLVGDTVNLNGGLSLDLNDDPLTYSWALSQKPSGSSMNLDGVDTAIASLYMDFEGEYIIELKVNDGSLDSNVETVILQAIDAPLGIPPDPGESGRVNLQGVDIDNDGVRDDIQRILLANFPDDAPVRLGLSSLSKTIQTALSVLTTEEAVTASELMLRSTECLAYIFNDSNKQKTITDALLADVLNTRERTFRYLRFHELTAGQIIFSKRIAFWRESCDFNLDFYEGIGQ